MTTYQFYYSSLFLWSSAQMNVSHPSTFRKLVGMTLPFTLIVSVLLQRNTHLFLFSLLLFSSVTLNALLTIWCSRETALFLSFLAKVALVYLPTALSVALRPTFPFRQAQYAQVSLLKPAPACKLFTGLGSTNKSAFSLLLLSDSCSVLSSIFPFTSNSLADLAETVFSLLLFYQATMSPQAVVSPGEQCC